MDSYFLLLLLVLLFAAAPVFPPAAPLSRPMSPNRMPGRRVEVGATLVEGCAVVEFAA